MHQLTPSIISADFTRLAESLAAVAPYSDRWHVDVMDGHHVPNLTIGPMVVEAITACTSLPQDVHLMINNPDQTWEWYAKAGASRIAFHPHVVDDAAALCERISDAGLGAGVALDPEVGVDALEPLLGLIDHVVVMSVKPGFSGQAFMPEALPKLAALKARSDVELVIDGGVSLTTGPRCLEAGADTLVSASAIFGSDDPAGTAKALKTLVS